MREFDLSQCLPGDNRRLQISQFSVDWIGNIGLQIVKCWRVQLGK